MNSLRLLGARSYRMHIVEPLRVREGGLLAAEAISVLLGHLLKLSFLLLNLSTQLVLSLSFIDFILHLRVSCRLLRWVDLWLGALLGNSGAKRRRMLSLRTCAGAVRSEVSVSWWTPWIAKSTLSASSTTVSTIRMIHCKFVNLDFASLSSWWLLPIVILIKFEFLLLIINVCKIYNFNKDERAVELTRKMK